MDIRIGQGIDVHQFAEGRRLVLGGVEIPHSKGLLGHSDADVLLHSVMDSVLGAIGYRDIGTLFPNTDIAHKDADSSLLLREVWQRAKLDGWRVNNLDVTVLAEAPKIAPYVAAMQSRIAEILECETHHIAIKATTTESLGFVGREEGVVALAVILLIRK